MLISKKISFNLIILKINHNYPFNKLTQNTFIMYDRRSCYIDKEIPKGIPLCQKNDKNKEIPQGYTIMSKK